MDDALLRRLEAIERRLGRLENQLDSPPQAPMPVMPIEPAREPSAPADTPVTEAAPSKTTDVSEAVVPPPLPGATVAKKSPAPLQPIAYRPVRANEDSRTTLEQTIGLKWAGWIGAVVLVIGAALGFKYAYDQGWLGNLPDSAKLACLSASGFALIALGEWVLRRINKASAAGLYGAGVAVLFLASFAGHAWYGLFAEDVATALSLASAAAGVLLAGRGQMVSIAVLSIVGASIAPLLIGAEKPNISSFLMYLLAVQLLALSLCYWQATARWWVLRSVSLVSLVLWMLVILLSPFEAELVWTLMGFAITFAALYHAELLLTTPRAARAGTHPIGTAAGVVFSVLVTAVFVGWMFLILEDSTSLIRGIWVIGTATVCAIVGVAVTNRPASLTPLGQSLRVQAVLLVVLAVPVLLDGSSILWAWALLAIALAIIGHIMNLPISMVGSVGVWMLSVAAWSGWQLTSVGREDWMILFGITFEARVVMAIALAFAGHLIGLVLASRPIALNLSTREALEQIGALTQVLAAGLFVAGAILLPRAPGTFLMIVYVWIALAMSRSASLRHMRHVAMGMIIATALKWLIYDYLDPRMTGVMYDDSPIANGQFGTGMMIAGTFFALMFRSQRPLRSGLAIATAIMVLLAGSVEIDRYARLQNSGPEWIVRQVGWSIYWAILGVTSVVIGFASRDRSLRIFGLVVLGATLIKVTIVDLSGAGTGWRILSFIGLGGILLGTSVIYGKFGRDEKADSVDAE